MKKIYRVKEGIVELVGYPDSVQADDCECNWISEAIACCKSEEMALELAKQYDDGLITYDNFTINGDIIAVISDAIKD